MLPNEILHHHGPLSDLERFPTMNLKFDKEIPDVLEYSMLGAGRLVLHVPNVDKALVLDNVLFINSKEEAPQEADEPARGPRDDRPGSGRARHLMPSASEGAVPEERADQAVPATAGRSASRSRAS